MLKPDYFTYKSDNLVKLYQELEDWIIKDLSIRLLKSGEMSGTADWRIYKLEQMGLHRLEIEKRIMKLSGLSEREVRLLLKDAVLTSYDYDKEVLEKMGVEIENPLMSESVKKVVDAQLIRTNNEFRNLTRTTMNQTGKDLIQLMDEAQLRVNMGIQSYSSAICELLDQYAKKGVIIEYPSGSKKSLESAVQVAMLTSMNQTAAQVTNHYISENEVEYVLTSAHYGARHDKKYPETLRSHDWWQGKIFKIHGSEPEYPNLLECTGYTIDENGVGKVVDPLGLHGYGCRHSHTPAFKGMENPYDNPKQAINKAESQKIFELQQKQRQMERGIRSTKRYFMEKEQQVQLVTEEALRAELEAERDKIAYKLRMQNKHYDDFCSKNGLRRQGFRTKTVGFNKDMAAKARGRATVYENNNVYKGVPKDWENKGKALVNLKSINPNDSRENCANCIVAYEMRQRGYEVIANDKKNEILLKEPWKAWENIQLLEEYQKDDIIDIIKTTNGNCRYGIAFETKTDGHCVVIEKYGDSISIVDAQVGERFSLDQYPLPESIKAWKTMENDEFAELSVLGGKVCRKET